ncbi:protein translocase subunit SecF [Amycolatopsis sp. CA-230715]|uniref:protein translocase subunit SecF n=1 Tax=Amycolatopsis sp. CA-230715 TaxID=2745196 RepID=UPI001C014E05|nr:protein translocase subunit SecF [Amycolatopsis sp. CA-230715]QWF84215.1 Protein translocase subunit SecF [Amycolatopsis sp. CA-230715]
MAVEEHGNAAGETSEKTPNSGKRESFFHRLYVGTGAFNIVGNRKRWYVFFSALVLVCVASMGIKGFNLGIEFEGGTQLQMPAKNASGTEITEPQVKEVFSDSTGKRAAETQIVGKGTSAAIQIRSDALNNAEVAKLKQDLFTKLKPVDNAGRSAPQIISDSAVSASWGGEISQKALIALAVFLVLVTIFLAVYFERWMAIAALISLIHDIVVTAGVYSLVGFEVTPATVIGLLTILGFSLYDTVVVFDKVKENTRGLLGLTRRDYGEAANLALNQTLMRSINTAVIAMLPILGLLVIGYILLGSGTLQDLALVQLTGTIVGVLSSVALATPLLVDFKMRDPKYRQQAARVKARKENLAKKAAERGGSSTEDDLDVTDDEALEAELRKEKAYAAAASVPARNQKQTPRRTSRPSGKRRR